MEIPIDQQDEEPPEFLSDEQVEDEFTTQETKLLHLLLKNQREFSLAVDGGDEHFGPSLPSLWIVGDGLSLGKGYIGLPLGGSLVGGGLAGGGLVSSGGLSLGEGGVGVVLVLGAGVSLVLGAAGDGCYGGSG